MARGDREPLQLPLARGPGGVGIGAGVQLHERRAHGGHRVELGRVGVDEQAHEAAGLGQRGHGLPQAGTLLHAVEASLGGHLGALLGHDAEGLGAGGQREPEHLGVEGALQVEERAQLGPQAADVVVLHVAAVLAQVAGDPVGARSLARQRPGHRVREGLLPGLPQGGDVVDVDVEAEAHGEWSCRCAGERSLGAVSGGQVRL